MSEPSQVSGLFTRSEMKPRSFNRRPEALSDETMKRLLPSVAAQVNPRAKHPNIAPRGATNPLVYVLADIPDAASDNEGKPLAGSAGKLLRSAMPGGFSKLIRTGYIVPTIPPKGRNASALEVEAFRDQVERDIEDAKPAVVLGLGQAVLTWALRRVGEKAGIACASGRLFPLQVRSHLCWFLPIHHPAYLLTLLGTETLDWSKPVGYTSDPLGGTLAPLWHRWVQRACSDLQPPRMVDADPAKVQVIQPTRAGWDRLKERLAASTGPLAFDFETTALRPYNPTGRLLCIGLADDQGTFSYPLDHPSYPWPEKIKPQVLEATRGLLSGDRLKVAHNLNFDLEWAAHRLDSGDHAMLFAGTWADTMVQAHLLDDREGGLSLQFLTRLHFGRGVKDVTGFDRKRPTDYDLDHLLRYCGLDSMDTRRLWKRQNALLKSAGLPTDTGVTSQVMALIPAVVKAQLDGMHVDQKTIEGLHASITAQHDEAFSAMRRKEWLKQYTSTFGPFNPLSQPHVRKLFNNVLKIQVLDTTDEVLRKTGHPAAESVLKVRRLNKLLHTYVDAYRVAGKKSLVAQDHRVHTRFSVTGTSTGRLASDEPNLQNVPTRTAEGRAIRSAFKAMPGHSIVSIDYGQIEYRVMAMASKDRVIVDSCFTGYDVHMDWAKRMVRLDPDLLIRYADGSSTDEDVLFKQLRSKIKNAWVFPAFYLSHVKSRAKNLGLDDDVARKLDFDFWKVFHGMRAFHQSLLRFYERHGYVQTLSGRRRYAPMNKNMIVNSPIQGTASEIVTSAMTRLAHKAHKKRMPWISPRLNIHDDLVFHIPDQHREEALDIITKEMIKPVFPFINVPLLVEVKAGSDWSTMKELFKTQTEMNR